MDLPANTFSARHESCGEDTASSRGTTITSGVANAKGSWATIKTATGFTYEGVTVYFANNAGTAATFDFMVDIGIDDGAGNVFVIVPDIHWAPCYRASEHNLALSIPVHVPSGSKLVARAACSNGLSAGTISCIIVGHSANPGGFPGYSHAVALFTPSLSRGVAIDPGAVTNTKGAWAQLIASCPNDIEAIFGVIGFNGDTSRAATGSALLDIGIGAAAAEFIILPDFSFTWGLTWDGPNDVFFQSVACVIPTGTRVAARGQCSHATAGDRTWDIALYGLVS